jgi:hypothetical protein
LDPRRFLFRNPSKASLAAGTRNCGTANDDPSADLRMVNPGGGSFSMEAVDGFIVLFTDDNAIRKRDR